jgi:hypothetical protein
MELSYSEEPIAFGRWRPAWHVSSLGVVAIVLVSVVSLNAAAPRVILVSGPLLERPILIDDLDDNARIMASVNNRAVAASEAPTDRPYYEFALFWRVEWVHYINEGRPVAALKSEQATQHARFYPAVGTAPALFVYKDEPGKNPRGDDLLAASLQRATQMIGLVRSVEQMALDVFVRYGLRVRMDATARP